jgi:uncharacterized protein YbjT (DUF2867 family)
MKIGIAGASGFVGRALIQEILDTTAWDIVCFSRTAQKKNSGNPRVQWRQVDFFNLAETENALREINCLYYLVHSMLPSAHLDQGSFEDYDLLLADNVSRAAEANKIRHLVYLGGIIPLSQTLSAHLGSRLEVEKEFQGKSFGFTVLRAGLILGPGGSSFNILFYLVKRLPILVCPKWARNPMTPVDLRDVSVVLRLVGGGWPRYKNKIYEIGGPETYTYRSLLEICAKMMNKKRVFITIPFSLTEFSKLWVRLFSGASKELVYPLVDSLNSPMKLTESLRFPNHKNWIPYSTSLKDILNSFEKPKYTPAKFKNKIVRSLQRMPMPKGMSAKDVAQRYMEWLPQFLRFIVKVEVKGLKVDFSLFHKRWVVLKLEYLEDQSAKDRAVFFIKGGLLVRPSAKGRLEFREVSSGTTLLVGIHDFRPRLPWAVYRSTQAILHRWVMSQFEKHLR